MQQKEDTDAIQEFCDRFNIKIPELPLTVIGNYALVSMGPKDPYKLVEKIWCKELENGQTEDYVNGHEADVFNYISDYARCSVLVPSYRDLPQILEKMVQQLGGEISLHTRSTYKAVHLHTQLTRPVDPERPNDQPLPINCEIQFHTSETIALKEATHAHYKKWKKALATNRAAVESDPEYQSEVNFMSKMCAKYYTQSGFTEALPAFKVLMAQYNRPVPAMDCENFVMLLREMPLAQELLEESVRESLTRAQKRQTAPEPTPAL